MNATPTKESIERYERTDCKQTPVWEHEDGHTRVEAMCFGGMDLSAREANLGRHSDSLEWRIVARRGDTHTVVDGLPGADEAEAVAVAHQWMASHPEGL